jgi:hypothetical protein
MVLTTNQQTPLTRVCNLIPTLSVKSFQTLTHGHTWSTVSLVSMVLLFRYSSSPPHFSMLMVFFCRTLNDLGTL